jgi:regulator of nonsense transcripts 3
MAPSGQSSAKSAHTNGVLQVTAAQTSGNPPKSSVSKNAPRLKVIVRRLAPGLTEAEFTTILGEEWLVGKGKVDWMAYKPGKESKE